MQMLNFVDKYGEDHYDGYAFREWLNNNTDVALYIAAGYLAFVFTAPNVVAKIFGPPTSTLRIQSIPVIKKIWAVWNLLLSAFAFYGTTRVAPPLLRNLKTHGLHDTLCRFRPEEFYTTDVGFALGLFTMSKVPEFGDTFFLILQGKRTLPFLQWFHHTSMFLFVWFAYASGSSTFICAAAMNYAVHTIMYFYFAMAEAGFKNLVKPFAQYITILQLIQMIGVMFVSSYALYQRYIESQQGIAFGAPNSCSGTSMSNTRLQLVIYTIFLYLFGQMYMDAYVRAPRVANKSTSKPKAM